MEQAKLSPKSSQQLSSPSDLNTKPTDTLAEALRLRQVTEYAWQVCDTRQQPHSPGYLLGFIEVVGAEVELMQLGKKFTWTRFPTFQDAINHVATTAYVTSTERAAGDLAWISH